MSHIRLIGLLLFITAITLALAAASTRTTHIQISSQWMFVPVQAQPAQADTPYREPVGPESSTTIPAGGSTAPDYAGTQQFPSASTPLPEHSHVHNWDYAAHETQYDSTAIPIAWPLLGTGAAGLLLWFIQAPAELRRLPTKRRTRARRR